MPKQVHTAEELQRMRETLRRWFPPGSTGYTILRHCSRSGMLRVIDVVAIVDGEPVSAWGYVGAVLDWPVDRDRGGVKVSGCGMDMGFYLVYALSRHLYNDGKGGDSGYNLNHRWL